MGFFGYIIKIFPKYIVFGELGRVPLHVFINARKIDYGKKLRTGRRRLVECYRILSSQKRCFQFRLGKVLQTDMAF